MGLFDQDVDPEDGVTLDPSPVLASFTPPSPMELGVPEAMPMQGPQRPAPTPPQAPSAPGNMQRILSMALIGLAAGLGPRRGGGGIAGGLLAGQHGNDVARQQQFQNEQHQYEQQQREANRQQEQAQRDAEVRAQKRAQAVKSIADIVPTLTTKEEYDRFIDRSGQWLMLAGHRDLTPDRLRVAFPYTSPDAPKRARAFLDSFFKGPIVVQQLRDDPDAVKNGSVQFDRQGDGKLG